MFPIMSPGLRQPTLPMASAPASAAGTSHRRRPATRGVFAAPPLLAVLLLVLCSCSPSTASNSPTVGVGQASSPSSTPTAIPPVISRVTPAATISVNKTVPPAATPTRKQLRPTPAIQEIAHSTTLYNDSTGPATATCPQGEYALGGGWHVPNQDARVFAALASGSTWAVSVHPLVGDDVAITVTAYVECLYNVSGAVVTRRPVSSYAAPTTSTQALGTCNTSEAPVGFGFDFGTSSANIELQQNNAVIQPGLSRPEWNFSVMNHDSVGHQVTFYLDCLSNVTVSNYPAFGNTSLLDSVVVFYTVGGDLYGGQTQNVSVTCPAGSAAAGGGYDYMEGDAGQGIANLYLLHASPAGWQGSLYDVQGYGLYALVFSSVSVLCLTFS